MTLLTWILVGSIVGLLAGIIMGRGKDRRIGLNIFLGVVGAVIGGVIIAPRFGIEIVNQPSSSVPSMLVGLVSAILVVVGFHLYKQLKPKMA